jgi:hypothetical protein
MVLTWVSNTTTIHTSYSHSNTSLFEPYPLSRPFVRAHCTPVSLTLCLTCIHVYFVGSHARKAFLQSSTAECGGWLTLLLQDRFLFLQSTYVLRCTQLYLFPIVSLHHTHDRVYPAESIGPSSRNAFPQPAGHRDWLILLLQNETPAQLTLASTYCYLSENARLTTRIPHPAKSIGSRPRNAFPLSSTAATRH